MSNQPTQQPIERRIPGKYPVYWTKERSITRRGVVWVGHACDIKCVFCYRDGLDPQRKRWKPFDGPGGVKEEVTRFRYTYNDQYVDFMGGEPTRYPHIYDLTEYCARIGLEPTCITHGMHLADLSRVQRFKEAGIHDFLVSIHGIGSTNDEILRAPKEGATEKQLRALENLVKVGIPFRFNVTLIDTNKEQLPEIARLAVTYGAPVINWISFNPYFEWRTEGDIEFQGKHSAIAPYLKQAIDICMENGIEANVRYMPLCQLRNYESHIYNGHQLPYDQHEWDYNSWYDYHEERPSVDWYRQAGFDQQRRHSYVHGAPCLNCAARTICDGFHEQYANRFGFSEAQPYEGDAIDDPTHFIRDQVKMQYIRDESNAEERS